MYELHLESEFAAGHFLRGYEGKCERLHGHNWRIQVVLESDRLNGTGMVMDFKDARAALEKALQPFDHQLLNDVPPFVTLNPTTEHVARTVYEALSPLLPQGVRVQSVTSWESPRCGATYRQ
jgi:6-pyruvoyltetrahydropterin/6-carboxytetrahydropterin synthase